MRISYCDFNLLFCNDWWASFYAFIFHFIFSLIRYIFKLVAHLNCVILSCQITYRSIFFNFYMYVSHFFVTNLNVIEHGLKKCPIWDLWIRSLLSIDTGINKRETLIMFLRSTPSQKPCPTLIFLEFENRRPLQNHPQIVNWEIHWSIRDLIPSLTDNLSQHHLNTFHVPDP